jgi:transcriptional regulator with XRE-family HTH domain
METPIIRAKTRQEIADEYGIDRKTLNKWLIMEDLIIPSGIIKPCHLIIIYETFGVPKTPNFPQIST